MSTIYRNAVVPIPEGARISKSDARVMIVTEKRYFPEKQYNVDQRKTIVLAINDHHMYPNSFFRWKYPKVFSQYSKENLPVHTKSIGLYVASLAIGQSTGLYRILIDSYGIESANMIMDYAMHSIPQKSNVDEQYPSAMRSQLLYLDDVKDDT